MPDDIKPLTPAPAARVAPAPKPKAKEKVKLTVERYCEVHGGIECNRLAAAKAELATVEQAIKRDGNPRLHNHVSAKRRIESLTKQIETLTNS